ncbi:cell wall-binding repeat-containing protein [Alteribacter natronophilus]|uniref:cell wall-binding repeat-containing protein n=1 Tax=Alteribacter natronophilus TaxID=2583810 RepID=UPI00110E1DDA|nr:cell wall-binding repeat-containing protein [Alteribacter natronophilus]TMW73918.1 cell wall-binding repeat-containing protein [Alteribacter natronophilus]
MMKKAKFLAAAILTTGVLAAACAPQEDQQDNMDDDMEQGDMDHEDMDEHHEDMDEHHDEDEHHEEDSDNGHHDDDEHHSNGEEHDASPPGNMNDNAREGLQVENTKNVTRISEDNPVAFSVLASQTIWPATHEENQPGTVILAPLDQWQYSLASLTLVHHPNDGPVLYYDESLTEEVMDEINRLQPKGNSEGIEVMVMGDLSEDEMDKLDSYELEHLTAEDPASFAALIDEHYAELTGSLPENVIVGSMEDDARLMTSVAGDWISHMDEPLLYVESDDIPEATVEALEKREDAVIYIVGSENEVSGTVEEDLSSYGEVKRIDGDNPVDLSIAFASYYDEDTGFGWGIDEPGHGLTFASTSSPDLAVPGSPLAHLGKHAPMIWLEDGELNESVYEYLAELKPTFENDPTEGPYNHGYLFGSEELIDFYVQGIIDERMEIVSASGDDHGGH